MFWKKVDFKKKPPNLTEPEAKFEKPDNPDIIIVGAGVAGLACAEELLEYEFKNIFILEAEDRIGGRILTESFASNIVDLGAQWCYGQKNNAVFQKVKSKQLLEPEMHIYENSQHIRSNGDILSNKLVNQLTKIIVNILDDNSIIDSKCSLRHFVEPLYYAELESSEYLHISHNVAKEFLDNFLKVEKSDSSSVSSPADVSAPGTRVYKHCPGEYMLNWKGQGFVKFLECWMNVQDPRKSLGDMQNYVKFGHKVETIVWNTVDTLVHVTCDNGEKFIAHHVIVTVPLGVLKECKDRMFDPPLPQAKLNAIEGLGFNKICKIFLQFRERFWPTCWTGFSALWRKDDLAELQRNPRILWVKDIFGFYRVDNQPNVLMAWLVGNSAPKVEKMAPRDVKNGCMFVLRKFLRRMHLSTVSNICWSKWCSSPNFCGGYSYRAVRTEQLHTAATALEQPLVVLAEVYEYTDEEETEDENQMDVAALNEGTQKPRRLIPNSGVQPLTYKPLVLFAGEATSEHHFSTVHGAIQSGRREAKRLAGYYLRSDKI